MDGLFVYPVVGRNSERKGERERCTSQLLGEVQCKQTASKKERERERDSNDMRIKHIEHLLIPHGACIDLVKICRPNPTNPRWYSSQFKKYFVTCAVCDLCCVLQAWGHWQILKDEKSRGAHAKCAIVPYVQCQMRYEEPKQHPICFDIAMYAHMEHKQ